ncbi:acyl-CoA dehydrogenase family protein [Capnocytophaga cynodegmi]|uniref:Putative acyl-CoA dehydrogenase n=1 Tax=Capnocytophaga cynodegmi TaxID=28189 RepID=A0A0B7HDK0_9FLAO|nr:acyl-CoA dehydrogenase family protein [Capnocytophaga cynodegmi]CEN35094.1 putative acyl-CoA dehydrogenase [Capnocytophaga cynodegmi]CEN35653.1 putative acyl-CoA dehydrogenase [Capnocytophaga cynodegmi]
METTRGGEFLVKETLCENIFTPEDFSQEQILMKDTVKEFVDKEIYPNKPRFEQKDYAYTIEMMKKIGEMGLLGIAIPEEYGGLGMGFVTTSVVCDYISGATGSFATAFGAHTGIGTMPILLYGTEEQKQKYLPKLATGEAFGAYCLTEPEAGSDANAGKTKAELSPDGKFYILNGQKMWISNAGFATILTVFARINDDKNITAFIVEYDPSNPNGITLGEEEHKLGIHASSTRQIFFNNTKVPVENMLSERNNGFKIALNVLNIGRIKLSVATLDAQRCILENSVNYAKERIQFGTRIAEFGAIKAKIAEIASNLYAGEAAVYRTLKEIENRIEIRKSEGNAENEAELKSIEEYAIECSILKVVLSENIQRSSDEGIQIFGGMGYSAEMPMESAWRDARITRIYEGTNEINRMLSVGMLIKKAMKGHVDLLTPAMAIKDELMGIPSFEIPDFSEVMSEEKELIARLKKVFLMVSGFAIQKYGTDLEKHQLLLMVASDIMMEIYMAESVVLRAEKNAKRFGEENQKVQIAMARLCLYQSVEKIITRAKEGIISFSEADEQRMLLMGLKRFTKYHNYPKVIDLKEFTAEEICKK